MSIPVLEILKPDDLTAGMKKREIKKPAIPPGVAEGVEELVNPPQTRIDDPTVAPLYRETNVTPAIDDRFNKSVYSISYEPLCAGKIMDIPNKLNYRPIDGFTVTKLNDLNIETIDEGLNSVLDHLCTQSKTQGFTHWKMTVEEKIRAFLNLRLNSVGPTIEHLIGVCSSCGKEKVFLKVEISKFDEKELNSKYTEPFPLKVKNGDNEQKFKSRLIRSGDIYRAKQIYEKDKVFINKMFVDATDKDKDVVIQILEYANTIYEIDGVKPSYEESVKFCKDSIQIMNALTSFNDYFYYGMSLVADSDCPNEECSSVTKDEETGKLVHRGVRFRFPIQPGVFHIAYTERETVEQYFDL